MRNLATGVRLDLFTVMPQSDAWVEGLFWVFLVSAVLLTIGFLTRISSVIVFLCLTSIHQRNLYIIHSGDTFMRVAGILPDVRACRCCAIDGSMDSCPQRERGYGDSAASALGAAHDSVRDGAGLFRYVLLESERRGLGKRHCSVLRDEVG